MRSRGATSSRADRERQRRAGESRPFFIGASRWVALSYRADLAQLAEQRFCKPQVPGSRPGVGSEFSPKTQRRWAAVIAWQSIDSSCEPRGTSPAGIAPSLRDIERDVPDPTVAIRRQPLSCGPRRSRHEDRAEWRTPGSAVRAHAQELLARCGRHERPQRARRLYRNSSAPCAGEGSFVGALATLPIGHQANRTAMGEPWVVEPFSYEDDAASS
jgi:hypothetical protein